MSQNQGHPLPAPPGQEQRPVQQRGRAKSTFSFHSHKSSGSGSKDLTETHEDKEKTRLHTKADPSMAITELEPSAVARQASSLADIRAIQHRDNEGNPIAEPDRSNPTRSRWERPLDTIRSFEAAVDGNYSRKSNMRGDSSEVASNYNRRNSYFGGTQASNDERSRYAQNGYYGGGRNSSHRPESAFMDGSRGLEGRSNGIPRPPDSYNGGEGGGPSNGYHPNRARYPRNASEPHFGPGGGYPPNGNAASYETVTNGSGSSAEPAGYSTDPSSENSSVDRIAPAPREPGEAYGFNGFGNNPQQLPGSGPMEQYAVNGGPVQQGSGYARNGPPPLPRKQSAGPRVPIQLGTTSGNVPVPERRPAPAEKRKSWFGKKFSRA